jgi:multicomponent Na+:H+ antiporter subunit D
LLIRFTFSIFGISFSFTTLPMETLFLVLGLLGIFIASTVAIYQDNIKHVFAYSSVAQVGYMIVGFSLSTHAGLTAMLLHMFNHALMKGALFLALAAVIYRVGSARIADFQGLGRQMPLTIAAIVVGGLSLIGVPLTVGFVSKWYLVVAAIESGLWWVAGLVLLGSLLAVIYVWRIVETAYFKAPMAGRQPVKEAPMAFLVPVWLLVSANVYFGVDTRLSVEIATAAAKSLFGVAQ